MSNPRNPHNMPAYMDTETLYLRDKIEQHISVIGDILHKAGMEYYTIGMIRIPEGTEKTVYEVWIVPHASEGHEGQTFEEFDHTAALDDYDLLFHAVNWPDEWWDELSGGWPDGLFGD